MISIADKKLQILITSFLIILLAKLLLDSLFYFISLTNIIENVFNALLVLFEFLLFYFIVKKSNFDLRLFGSLFKIDIENLNDSNQRFVLQVKVLKYLLLLVYIIMLVVPGYYNRVYIENNFYAKLLISFLAPIYIIPIFYIIYIFFQRSKKNSKTLSKFYTIVGAIVLFHLVKIIDDGIYTFFPNVVTGISFITTTIVTIMSIFLFNNNHWIAFQSKKLKYSIIINSFIIIIISIFITYQTDSFLNDYSSSISFTYDYYFYGLSSTVNLIAYSSIFIFIRFLVTSVIYLPSSEQFERRRYEMVSLTNLNKIILESKNIEHITNSVTEIAFKMTNSLVAWAELYNLSNDEVNKDEIQITSSYQLSEQWINDILSNVEFNAYRKEISVLEINENIKTENFTKFIPYANSFIYIPIVDDDKKIGGICLIKNKKYNLDEDELEILKAFSVNISIAFQNVRLLNESIEIEKYKNELQIAKNIQEKLLPKKLIEFDGFTIDAISIQADDVGGDFYDSVRLSNGDVCYLIGDVSGKGIGAAIFMAQIKGMVLSLASNCVNGKELLSKINSSLYGNIEKNMFVTITAITVSNKSNKISYCRAGHTPLAVLDNKNNVEFIKSDGFGIGFVNEYLFNKTLEERLLDKEDVKMIFGFSDGLNELRNSDNKEFGFESISFVLKNFEYNSAKELNALILEKANFYSKSVKQFDDLTLLTIYKTNI